MSGHPGGDEPGILGGGHIQGIKIYIAEGFGPECPSSLNIMGQEKHHPVMIYMMNIYIEIG